ncbi:MAG: DUF2818 family protein [Burkholderiaceae bacterium]
MNTSASSWLVIALALLGANLPFVSNRLFAVLPFSRAGAKPAWARLGELVVLYFVVGFIGRLLEARAGNAFEQTWEFYAITVFLFLVFAFPGFVYRYLLKRRD